jgi:hypothetical protein
MADSVQINLGIFSLGGIGGHLVIAVTDNGGNVITEFNGLATKSNGESKARGFPWQFNDKIKAYEGITGMYSNSVRQIELASYTAEEYELARAKIDQAILDINQQDLDYRMLSQNSNSVARTILEALGIAPQRADINDLPIPGYGRILSVDSWQADMPKCFPAHTLITTSPTQTKPISDIRVGDTVLAFDPTADLGRGALLPRKVVRLYRNTTDEWVKLTWVEGGKTQELVTTPGHHFLDRFGQFPTIEAMLQDSKLSAVIGFGVVANSVPVVNAGWRTP